MDIVSILFNERLLKEVIESGSSLWSTADMRQILEKIVSSSLMRMDPLSMEKLWQLGTAVLRWQLHWNYSLVALTTAHLNGVAMLCQSPYILKAHIILQDFFQSIPFEKQTTMRNAMVLWLNDHRTKVSLLIRLQLQKVDGYYNSPTEATAHFFDNLGENIYSYVSSEDSEADKQNEYHFQDVAEINSLVCSVMAQQNNDKVQIKLPFLDRKANSSKGNENNSTITIEKSVYKIEESKRTGKVSKELFSISEPENTNSLHDDLITMLES